MIRDLKEGVTLQQGGSLSTGWGRYCVGMNIWVIPAEHPSISDAGTVRVKAVFRLDHPTGVIPRMDDILHVGADFHGGVVSVREANDHAYSPGPGRLVEVEAVDRRALGLTYPPYRDEQLRAFAGLLAPEQVVLGPPDAATLAGRWAGDDTTNPP